MIHSDLGAIASPPLLSCYHLRFYGEGDLDAWLHIQAHDSFFVPDDTTLLVATSCFSSTRRAKPSAP